MQPQGRLFARGNSTGLCALSFHCPCAPDKVIDIARWGLSMKNVVVALALALLTGPVLAADTPDWAYPVTPKPEPKDNVVLKQMPGSSKQYTQAHIDDRFNPPDWFPDEH